MLPKFHGLTSGHDMHGRRVHRPAAPALPFCRDSLCPPMICRGAKVSRVPVEGIKPCTLANTGLLVATLMRRGEQGERKGGEGKGEEEEEEKGEVVAQVNLVVQVTNVDVAKGRLTRVIYSPLE